MISDLLTDKLGHDRPKILHHRLVEKPEPAKEPKHEAI